MRADAGRPVISVAMATRDGAHHVAAQLDSILSQTVAVDEIVLSDDASGDGTADIVEELIRGQNDPPDFRVLRNPEPLGVTTNFEQAIAACRGDVIALSDQDDVWHATRLAEGLALLGAPNQPTLVHADARLVDEAGTPLGRTLFESLEVTPADLAAIHQGRAFRALLRRNLATGATVMFRRALLEVARPFPPEWVHDEWLAIIASATGGVDVVERPLIDYRQHGGNQIGVRKPTLRFRISRVLEPGGGRNASIAHRFELLRERVGSRLAAEDLDALEAKIAHERVRAAMPSSRIRRIPAIVREWRAGAYSRYSSRGRWDAIRDLVQPR